MTSDGRRRVVLVHRYYAPDTPPYGHILRELASTFVSRGYAVSVLTCQPSYNRRVVTDAPTREVDNGVEVFRWRVLDDRDSRLRKVFNLIWFCVRLTLSRQTFRDADVVMAATTPPVAIAALCGSLARRHGAAFVYHKQDIYPEVLGPSRSTLRRLVTSILRRLDSRNDRLADAVVVLSQDMATTTVRRSGSARVKIINNFDPWPAHTDAMSPRRPRDTLTLAYAGNLGNFQDLDGLALVVGATVDWPGIQWHFFGEGVKRPLFEQLAAKHSSVVVHGYQPAEVVASFLRERADLGVVSLEPNVIRAAYPSKTMTYLRNGCPLLAVVEPESELATMVRQERIGVTSPQGRPDLVVEKLLDVSRQPEALAGARQRAFATYRARFIRDRQLSKWADLLDEVSA